MFEFGIGSIIALAVLVYLLLNIFRIVPQTERLVILRFGKLTQKPGGHGPGFVIVLPLIDKAFKVDTRTIALDVPSQDIITKDNVSLTVNAVVYYRVIDPEKAVTEVFDYYFATSQLAQTLLRSVCGQFELDILLSDRETINHKLQSMLDLQTEPWGVKVINVELKNVDLPKEMQRAMSRQAEAERERRSKIISAEGELQASVKLVQAAEALSTNSNSMQLRYLQTLNDITKQNDKFIIFPIPIEMLKGFFNKNEDKS